MSYFENFDKALDKVIKLKEIEDKLQYWNEEPYKLAEVHHESKRI